MPSLTSQWPSREQLSDQFFSDEHQEKLEKAHSKMNVEDCMDLIH